ncbi:hypothetical protein D1872_311450 [compost metagenome]
MLGRAYPVQHRYADRQQQERKGEHKRTGIKQLIPKDINPPSIIRRSLRNKQPVQMKGPQQVEAGFIDQKDIHKEGAEHPGTKADEIDDPIRNRNRQQHGQGEGNQVGHLI